MATMLRSASADAWPRLPGRSHPALPVAFSAHGRQAPVVLGLVLLEVAAEVHQRLGQQAPMLQQRGNQQPSDAAVAIQEGVDGLELGVDQCDPHQRRQVGWRGVMDEALQVCQQIGTRCGGGGTKAALPGRVPPIQFCERRSSPGCLPAPRTPSSSSRCASHSRRTLIGNPCGSRSCPCTSGRRAGSW
jgi:hypothetical protein